MPRTLIVTPKDAFKQSKITIREIHANTYDLKIADELKIHSKDDLQAIYHDMCAIRQFETILNEIKLKRAFRDISYDHRGPAHLSIGQEPSAVGMAFTLDADDHIFGSHRSHGEILAKGLSAIRRMKEEDLRKVMESFFDGAILRVVEKGHKGSIYDLARRFLMYGAYAEIFGRETGFNRGLGGSMHAFFTPFGIYPNNAIVGGSGSVAPGAALYKRINRRKGLVICNIGDAAFGCGPVWEGITLSSMEQYRTLWDESHRGGLPLIFNCINNHYGMGGQPNGETMGQGFISRLGAGVNPDAMHAERVNGYDPLALIDAIRRKRTILENGEGPVLLETVTYRISGHSPSDASSYRTKEEIDLWLEADGIERYRERMIDGEVFSASELDKTKEDIEELTYEMCKLAVDLDISPRTKPGSEFISSVMYSNEKVEKLDDREPDLLLAPEENPRVKQIKGKSRYAFDAEGNAVSKMKVYNIRDGLFEAIFHRFCIDPSMVAFGEENRDWGGAFAVYRGLTEALPYHRLFNSSISEAAIVGASVGYAMEGGRVMPELMYCDFMGRAGDEIFNQLSKWQAMSGGVLKMPVVLRVSVGAKYGAQHSQDWSSMVAHIPGLKVVYPVTPYDAKGMMNAALAGTDPVIFLESQMIYDYGEMFVRGGVPEEYYEIDLSQPSVKREGTDLTIMTLGPSLYKAIKTADALAEQWGIQAEVIDLRSVCPLDYEPLIESVRKTGKVMFASEAVERGNILHTIASNLTRVAFDYLDAPAVVLASRNWITPCAELEEEFFPQVSWFLDSINENLISLDGHVPTTVQTNGEHVRRARLGV